MLLSRYKAKGLIVSTYKRVMPQTILTTANPNAGSRKRVASSASAKSTTSTTKSAIKQLPGKLAKKVKHQFHRLDSVLHHVIHPQQHTSTFSVISPTSPIFYPIGVVRAFVPQDQSSATGSVHSRDTWDVKYPQDIDVHSLEPPNSLANHSIDLSMSVADSSAAHIDMTDKQQEEPQSNLQEQDPSASNHPTVSTDVEVPDPFLIDDEEEQDSHSEEESAAEEPPSDTLSQQATQAVPLDLPSLPEPSTPQPQVLTSPLPNLQKDIPPPPSESEEEYVPDLYVPALIVPTMFLPIPNVRRSFSSNLLTWWLARNLSYNNCTRPIL